MSCAPTDKLNCSCTTAGKQGCSCASVSANESASSALHGVACVSDLAAPAAARLTLNALRYYNSGADGETTLAENEAAFRRVRLRPRALVDVSHLSTGTVVLGSAVSAPLGVAPTAQHGLADAAGECATARAAQRHGTVFVLSCCSNRQLEEVAAAAPRAVLWFQLYLLRDRRLTEQLVRRAELAGYSALVLTVDAQLFGNRLADVRDPLRTPPHLQLGHFSQLLAAGSACCGINGQLQRLFDPSLTWADVGWLRSITSLPVLVKGVMAPEDALRAVEAGCAGVIVSNHGGRQLDGCPASLEALPAVVAAVAGRCEVYMDGGVRRGTDVLKALALGARCVFVGRPVLWGLAAAGEQGAALALHLLKQELHLAMALTGVTNVQSITEEVIENIATAQL